MVAKTFVETFNSVEHVLRARVAAVRGSPKAQAVEVPARVAVKFVTASRACMGSCNKLIRSKVWHWRGICAPSFGTQQFLYHVTSFCYSTHWYTVQTQ